MNHSLETRAARLGYEGRLISENLSVAVPQGSFTVIIGPNACGKSTLLRALARVLPVQAGQVLLDSADIARLPSREVARRLSLLPQTSLAPSGITVADLVARGRLPYQNAFQAWRTEDEQAVGDALAATRLTELAGRQVDELSGGQRQRVWIALLLAQQTPLMLLDEPTTFLDIAHQYELLELLRRFHDEGKTVVAVLHDLNQAARYATNLIVMRDGEVRAVGQPQQVITPVLVQEVFGLAAVVIPDPVTGTPAVFPKIG